MKNPYKVLGISAAAGDADIKAAYIQMVKEFPPERFPEKFKEIREAYEAISTTRKRVAQKLFSLEEKLDPQDLVLSLLNGGERNPLPPKELIEAITKKFL